MAKPQKQPVATTGSSARPTTKQLVDEFGLSADAMTPVERRSAVSGYDVRHRIEAMVAGVTAKKIKHVYKGDGAATAPGFMILPRIPATHLFPIRHLRVLLGYTAHEISHQLKTDFGLLNALLEDKTRPGRQVQQIKEFWNAIEDYRIEKLVKRDYPGFHAYIDDTRDFSAGRFCDRVDAGQVDAKALSNPYRMGSVALTWVGARLNDYRTDKPRQALERLHPNLRAWIESWETDMAKVETCADARDLAITIVEELDRLREEDEQEDDKGGKGRQQQKNGNQQPGQQPCGSPQNGPQGGPQGGQPDAPKEGASQPGQQGKTQSGDDAAAAGDGTAQDESGAQKNGDATDQADGQKTDPESSSKSAEASSPTEGGDRDDKPQQGRDEDTNGDHCPEDASDGDDGAEGASHGDDGAEGDETGEDAQSTAPDGQKSGETADGDDAGGGASGDQDADNEDRRPDLKVEQGDEQSAAEAADLEIDDLSRAIRSIKGPEATDAKVHECDEVAGMGRGSSGGNAEEIVQQHIERGQGAYAELRQSIASAAARSAGILRRMLMSQTRRTWRGGREEGDLDFGRLVPMSQALPDIYRQRIDRTGVNTALCLLLDNSGSMTGHPIRVCQETAVVLDMAIQGTPTKVEIAGFTGCAQRPILYRYRSFGQTGQAASASLGNMDQVDLGGTPVSTPLLESWRRLSQQKEPRRILMVVSDGGADYNDVEAARQAHDFIVSQGCRIIGIAIGCRDAMAQWCDNCEAIESIDELPVALTKLVQEAMR